MARLAPQRISVLDWGVYDALRVLGEGELPIHNGMEPFLADSSLERLQPDAGVLFVDHAPGRRIIAGARQRFDARIRIEGLRVAPIAAVCDRKGRAVFEVFALEAAR